MSGFGGAVRMVLEAKAIQDQEQTLLKWASDQIGAANPEHYSMTVVLHTLDDVRLLAFLWGRRAYELHATVQEKTTGDVLSVEKWLFKGLSPELSAWFDETRVHEIDLS